MSADSSKHFNVPWSWKQALIVYFAAWIGLPILLMISVQVAGKAFPPAAALLKALSKGDVTAAFAFLMTASLAGLLLVKFFLDKYKSGWQTLGFGPFNLFRGAIYIFCGFWLFLLSTAGIFQLLTQLIPSFNASQPQVNEFTSNASAAPNLSLLALVILPPLFEETVFRGFIFPALSDRFGVVIGIIASSALFAVAHLQLNVSIYTFVLGTILAIMYWKLRSIWPGIFLHLLNNYLAFSALT